MGHTCRNLTGSLFHEAVDVAFYKELGVSFLKLDFCYADTSMLNSTLERWRIALQDSGIHLFYAVATEPRVHNPLLQAFSPEHCAEIKWKDVRCYVSQQPELLTHVLGP